MNIYEEVLIITLFVLLFAQIFCDKLKNSFKEF